MLKYLYNSQGDENLKFISWNIDSINAAVEHKSVRGEMTWSTLNEIATIRPDVFAIQETKLKSTGLTKNKRQPLQNFFQSIICM